MERRQKTLVVCLCLSLFVKAESLLTGPFTPHFQTWLKNNGFDQEMVRDDVPGGKGSFGGREYAGQQIRHEPVIFVHAATDTALQTHEGRAHGWTNTLDYFMARGYTSAELYATTWGPTGAMKMANLAHTCTFVMVVRQLVEAVLLYTGAPQVDVLAHSLGVTVTRRALKGGVFRTRFGGQCDVGERLTERVDTFIGIAGGNYGFCDCYSRKIVGCAACNQFNGFYPGHCGAYSEDQCADPHVRDCEQDGLSEYLRDLNDDPAKEARHVYAFWTLNDGAFNITWGKRTNRIAQQDGFREYRTLSHGEVNTETAADQYEAVVNHKV